MILDLFVMFCISGILFFLSLAVDHAEIAILDFINMILAIYGILYLLAMRL